MEKMVEVERATREELRQDLKSLFEGAMVQPTLILYTMAYTDG